MRANWQNEANWGLLRGDRRGAGGHGRFRAGVPGVFLLRLALPLNAAQLFQRAEVAALRGGEAPEDLLGLGRDERAEARRVRRVFAGDENLEEVSLDAGIAPPVPVGLDEGFHEEALQGADGVELLAIFERVGFEFGGVFAGDHEGSSFDAEFQGIEAGSGLAVIGARPGGALRVEAIGVDLCGGCHCDYRVAGGRGVERGWGLEVIEGMGNINLKSW